MNIINTLKSTSKYLFNGLVITALIQPLISCNATSSIDATEPLQLDIVTNQMVDGAINMGSLSSRPSRRDSILLGEKRVNDAGGVLGKEFNVVALLPQTTDEAIEQGTMMMDAGLQVVHVALSSRSKALIPIAKPRQVVLISESATSPDLTFSDDDDFYFRLPPSDAFQGKLSSELALSSGNTTAAILFNSQEAFSEGVAVEFKKSFEAGGGTIVANVGITLDQTVGFQQAIDDVYDTNPDVIMSSFLLPTTMAAFMNEAVDKNFNGLYIFPDSLVGRQGLFNNLADINDLDGAIGATAAFGLQTSPANQFFREAYTQQFNRDPLPHNATSYDTPIIMALAIERAGRENNTSNPTGVMIRDSMRAVMNPLGTEVGPQNLEEALNTLRSGGEINYSGAYSNTDWDEHGDVVNDVVFSTFEFDASVGDWLAREQIIIHIPLITNP